MKASSKLFYTPFHPETVKPLTKRPTSISYQYIHLLEESELFGYKLRDNYPSIIKQIARESYQSRCPNYFHEFK
jgi:hypothetical protein